MTIVVLGPAEMAVAVLLVLASAGLSWATAMGEQRPILYASARMAVQLLAVGYLLRFVFNAESHLLTLAVLMAMVLAAGRELTVRGRVDRGDFLGNVAIMAVASLAVTSVAILGLSRSPAIWDAQHVVPIFGIILGSALNSAAQTLRSLSTQVPRAGCEIETRLALGQDFATATRDLSRSAASAGMLSALNQMAGAGIITLPGVMSGQILAGQDPTQATLYQIFLMTLLLLTTVICVTLARIRFLRRITDDRQRLRLDRLGQVPGAKSARAGG